MRTRRVGTFTLGASLITFGILYMAHIFTINISYELIIKLWPIILIFLGIEVLISYFADKNGKIIYDGGAIFIIFLLTCFAIGMGCVDLLYQYAKNNSISSISF